MNQIIVNKPTSLSAPLRVRELIFHTYDVQRTNVRFRSYQSNLSIIFFSLKIKFIKTYYLI